MNDQNLLSTRRSAELMGVSPDWLKYARTRGSGPRFVKIGSRVLYDPADLTAFIDASKRRSTADGPAARAQVQS